ncbi:histidinol-phosphatase [Cellvibrio polysaccharolyticus]|uniref:Histidinol-phosphatase n=1 Tax=Cellvibrio polysaccharolyticus TaxID=2082724 RepID=A0A928YUZ1_9GAMM|nr:histidinol-phosphatase [Cellvibrio polysaccharolyticus]MBE8718482.1 histidinol-phosphatase [Cellvibrio polysaccharolyticus]
MSLTLEQIASLQPFAEELAEAAAAAIKPYFRSKLAVEDKGGRLFDPVTVADKAAEQAMRTLIISRYPEHGIVGEEDAARQGTSNLTWVLDPIDGTRAFITGLPLWGTLIALNDGEQPVIGVMNQPFTGERFLGTPAGAWCNGQPLKTRACSDIGSARVMCTTPDMFDNERQREGFFAVAADAQLVRFGGDCYAYCMLAMGLVDAVIESGLKTYDVQALIPIIKGAGGVITAWDGSDPQQGGTVLACGDAVLHEQLQKRLAEFI